MARYVEPPEVPSGLACECTCPACGENLLAKHARRERGPVSHFAHSPESKCNGGLETAIHQAAKQVIEQERRIWVPAVLACPFYYDNDNWAFIRAAPAQVVKVERVEVEEAVGAYRPDLILYSARGRRLAVEFVVTHPVSDEKEEFYEREKLSALAIDLKKVARKLSFARLRELLLQPHQKAKWLHNQFGESLSALFRQQAVPRDITWRKSHLRTGMVPHVDSCPFPPRFARAAGSGFANARLDCAACAYHWRGAEEQRLRQIWCAGHLSVRFPTATHEDWLSEDSEI